MDSGFFAQCQLVQKHALKNVLHELMTLLSFVYIGHYLLYSVSQMVNMVKLAQYITRYW